MSDQSERVGGEQNHKDLTKVKSNGHNNDMNVSNGDSSYVGAEDTQPPAPKKQWVKFDEDDEKNSKLQSNNTTKTEAKVDLPISTTNIHPHPLQSPTEDAAPAVLTTETVHININNSTPTNAASKLNQKIDTSTTQAAVIDIPSSPKNNVTNTVAGLRTVELSTGRVRVGFANGDVIVTLLPINTKFPWITPAEFRPELVPEELMAQGLTLTVEDYVHAMETLTNDYRFTMYNICYKRVLACWIFFAFAVLISILFSGLVGIALFCLGVGWLFLNALAIFLCMFVKLRLSRGLEKCLANVNKQLMRHKILLALDDRGQLSCHKVNLCFIYFDPSQCVTFLNEFIERHDQAGTNVEPGWEARLDISANDIVIQGSNTTRVSRKQERGALLFLRYASRWGHDVLRGLADVSNTEPARHCAPFMCPCQYIERHLSCKPKGKSKYFSIMYWVLASERYES